MNGKQSKTKDWVTSIKMKTKLSNNLKEQTETGSKAFIIGLVWNVDSESKSSKKKLNGRVIK